MTAPSFVLRGAQVADATEIARLATQLGYPASAEEMAPRLAVLLSGSEHAVFVAAQKQRLLGWIGVERRTTLETGEKAEIVGLVVDAEARRMGVGEDLLHAAEDWARRQGMGALMVRSNTARTESHPFYEKHGYARRKSQHVYFKPL